MQLWDGRGRFHVQELWQTQDIPDACRTHSEVLCSLYCNFAFLSSMTGEKNPQKKKKEEEMASQRANQLIAAPGLLQL
jgi:hypothetical protein